MGSVWAAVHEALDRTVAIKFLRPSGVDAETASARFVAEARSAARVKHRFVVDVFDFGITEDGVYYMVQDLLEGEELAALMDHGPAWEVRDVIRFVSDCLSGLEAVHQAGVVHRDLKPENIFVIRDPDGRHPKLLDFGISKVSQKSGPHSLKPPGGRGGRTKQLTSQGMTVGTPLYMSPEQLRGRKDLDARADLYSVGVILYEWLTGRVPYEHENVAELSLQVASGSAVPLVSLRPELGHDLSSVIARALAPEAKDRFASASEMRDALLAVLPSISSAWSVVQKSVRPSAIGAKTEWLLEQAKSPFAGDDDTALTGIVKLGGKRVRSWMLATGAAMLIALLSIPFFLHSRPERANAVGHEPRSTQETASKAASSTRVSETASKAASSPPVPAPVVTPLDKPAPAPVEQPKTGAAAEASTGEKVLAAPSETRSHASHGEAREKRKSSRSSDKKSPRKVIRTLDF
jgi:serine/threonine-protein kinase